MAIVLIVEDEDQVRLLAESYPDEQGTKSYPLGLPPVRSPSCDCGWAYPLISTSIRYCGPNVPKPSLPPRAT